MTIRSLRLRLLAPAFLAAALATSPVLADAPPPPVSAASDAGTDTKPKASPTKDQGCNANGKAPLLSGWLVALVPLAVTSVLRRRSQRREKHPRA